MRQLSLTSLRGPLLKNKAATTLSRTLVRPPKLAQLPWAPPPGGGLFLSAVVHTAAVFALLAGLPYLFPGRRPLVTNVAEDWLRDPDHEILYMPKLPRIERAGSHSVAKGQPRKSSLTVAKAVAESSDAASQRPKPLFVGPQVIVSDLPDATNNIQTIRLPDLVKPPKLPKPVLVQSMVMLPAHAPKAVVAPPVDMPAQPVVENPQELMSLRNDQPHIQVPVLPMGVPKQSSVVPAEAAVPKMATATDRALPQFSTTAPSAPESVVVINAVGVPPNASSVIPTAELSGSFVVGPASNASAAHGGSATTGGSAAGAGTGTGTSSAAGESSSHVSAGTAAGTGIGPNGSKDGTAPAGSLTISGGRSGSGGGSGSAAGSGNGSMPGISIAGGGATSTARSSGGVTIAGGGSSRRPYGMIVVSGGTSGGASRDLGVFSRDETVYTVYVPMSDAGGGPDWPIEYALVTATSGSGMLAPPVAVKKMQATGPKADIAGSSGPVFITGIIDGDGKLQGLRAIRVLDVRAESALKALAQWVFLPAQLDGKPVASRVLIGVNVLPTEEAAKRQ